MYTIDIYRMSDENDKGMSFKVSGLDFVYEAYRRAYALASYVGGTVQLWDCETGEILLYDDFSGGPWEPHYEAPDFDFGG